jgi:hypothetical protein
VIRQRAAANLDGSKHAAAIESATWSSTTHGAERLMAVALPHFHDSRARANNHALDLHSCNGMQDPKGTPPRLFGTSGRDEESKYD